MESEIIELLNKEITPVERWDKIGFLGGLDDEMKEVVAAAFDELAFYMMRYDNYCSSVSITAFPALRRILNNGELSTLYTPSALCDFLDKEIKRLAEESDWDTDIEVKVCLLAEEKFKK